MSSDILLLSTLSSSFGISCGMFTFCTLLVSVGFLSHLLQVPPWLCGFSQIPRHLQTALQGRHDLAQFVQPLPQPLHLLVTDWQLHLYIHNLRLVDNSYLFLLYFIPILSQYFLLSHSNHVFQFSNIKRKTHSNRSLFLISVKKVLCWLVKSDDRGFVIPDC